MRGLFLVYSSISSNWNRRRTCSTTLSLRRGRGMVYKLTNKSYLFD